jgi:hypothetical protein
MAWKTAKDNGIDLVFPGGGTDSLRVVFDPKGIDIAYVVPTSSDNGNGNAALIAAAPDLLEACIGVLDVLVGWDPDRDMPEDLDEAGRLCLRAVMLAKGRHNTEATHGR